MDETSTPVDPVLEDVRRSRRDTLDTIELLRVSRQQVEGQWALLESPKAVVEYIDFFLDLFEQVAANLERVADELPGGPSRGHLDTLRQIASNASAEQRRCLMFRDKWINKPLPYEEMRRLLNQISVDSRDQLTAYSSLGVAADRLDQMAGPAPKPPDGKLDRRALFTRWFGK
ncbi:MAG: hypothetical protein A3H97_22335 [Acidobacteria bacterium RIFCSPLOWO2_02_FULL_65_29]|nr:MAG: hypothetical protein A3H97_22335 [Acidobacteria bacterium RIFCSPLOWO2_02_FULL_65_29]